MGCGASKNLIETADGNEEGFHSRYLEDKVLGEGQFGQVKLVHDMRAKEGEEPLACKVLRKGVQFKDNTLWAPLDPKVLQGECDILRTLNGEKYCLRLEGIYETAKLIYMVTELCSGGEMMEYVSQQKELRTEDVSRIAHQLLTAVNHCAKHKVIHRDIKSENIMFKSTQAGAELRLIDFGSGCIDKETPPASESNVLQHHTFAGSAFYISPEMFQKNDTTKTDVWSCGVTLYVLVAGYPADELQKAFNLLQKSKGRDLKKLPNLPPDLPDSYFEMLEKLLVFRYKKRPPAGKVLKTDEFVNFWKEGQEISPDEVAQAAATTQESSGRKMNRTQSIKITGSVHRHALFLGYQKFERSLTALLVTMLNQEEFSQLLESVEEYASQQQQDDEEEEEEAASEEGAPPEIVEESRQGNLGVIPIFKLKEILEDFKEVLKMISELPNAESFDKFAYHIALLKQFSKSRGGNKRGRMSRNMSVAGGDQLALGMDDSIHSQDSKKNSSIHGNNVFKEWKSGRNLNPRRNVSRSMSMPGLKKRGDGLDNSWHLGS